jgi:hypothetical protein
MFLHKGQLTVDCRKYDLILGDTADHKMNGSGEIKDKVQFNYRDIFSNKNCAK